MKKKINNKKFVVIFTIPDEYYPIQSEKSFCTIEDAELFIKGNKYYELIEFYSKEIIRQF